MNRPIEFRAWDEKIKHMFVQGADDLETIGSFFHHMMGDEILMQFTGLLDKNGKKIFEGDVLRILYTDWCSRGYASEEQKKLSLTEYKKAISQIGIVTFYADGKHAEYGLQFNGYSDSIYHGTHGEREIIGNIYENPELLVAK